MSIAVQKPKKTYLSGPAEPHPRAASAAAGALLTNRSKTGRNFTPLAESLQESEIVVIPRRQGGPFDPCGTRASDVNSAQNICTIVDNHIGRWLMITLTVDRSEWLGPEAAYQRCNERVREVARAVSLEGIHIVTFELQTKTGEGWPHWHLIVFCPDDRPLSVIEEQVRKKWRIVNHTIDHETGEVTRHYQSIGIINVQQAREREGIARYVAKYVVKPWTAVPPWMGNSTRQLRKFRLSRGCFDWLELRGLHKPRRGGRIHKPSARRRRRRTLYRRMAASEAAMSAFAKVGGKLKWLKNLPIPITCIGMVLDVVFQDNSKAPHLVNVGKRPAIVLNNQQFQAVESRAVKDGPQAQSVYMSRRLREIANAWDYLQQQKQFDQEGQPPW